MKGPKSKARTRARATRRLLVVVDAAGRIVATASEGERNSTGPNVTLRPMPGQTLHEVPLPQDLEECATRPPADLHRVLSEYELRAGPAQSLLFRRVAGAQRRQRSRRH
jgi:hypothetical protein